MKAIAIDDEPLALQVIEKLTAKVGFITLEKTFTDPNAARNHLISFPVDLIFLDINMPSVNGINFYKSLKQETMVIFTTAFSEYAVKGFEVNAIDYLLKPIDIKRFVQACEKAQNYYQHIFNKTESKAKHLYVRSEYSLVKIAFEDILYFETLDDYIKIHLAGKKPLLTLMSMKKMMDLLPDTDFVRVHRSFIVSMSKIEQVRNQVIKILGNEIPIGITYLSAFHKVFSTQ